MFNIQDVNLVFCFISNKKFHQLGGQEYKTLDFIQKEKFRLVLWHI